MITAFGPGRVNLIGEHTDYNDGLALPFAIADGITVEAEPAPGGQIEAQASDLDEEDRFAADAPEPADGWRAFVRGAVGELRDLGVEVPGARLRISGTIARGSGLSSSAALEVALVLALLGLAGEERDRIELARLCSRIENEWVGAQTGLLDQLASLCGQADHALRIDFRSLEIDPVRARAGRSPAGDARLRRGALARRLGLQRAPPRMRRGLRAARRSLAPGRRPSRPPARSPSR